MKIIKPSTYEITPGDTILDRSFLSPFLSDEKELSGQVYHSLDPIGNWPAGTLAIALDTLNEEKDLLLATTAGFFGWTPIQSSRTLWEPTGQSFKGNVEDFEQLNHQATNTIVISNLPDVENELRKESTGFFKGDPNQNWMTATYFTPPKGPNGYRSDYYIKLIGKANAVQITVVSKGTARTLLTDPDNLLNAIQAAKTFLKQSKSPKTKSSQKNPLKKPAHIVTSQTSTPFSLSDYFNSLGFQTQKKWQSDQN